MRKIEWGIRISNSIQFDETTLCKEKPNRYSVFNFENNVSNGTIHVSGHQTYEIVSDFRIKTK